MIKFRFSNALEKDLSLMRKRGRDIGKFAEIVRLLAQEAPLPYHFRDHPLKGKWAGFRECHLEPDWLMIYRKADAMLILERTGTHADLFKN